MNHYVTSVLIIVLSVFIIFINSCRKYQKEGGTQSETQGQSVTVPKHETTTDKNLHIIRKLTCTEKYNDFERGVVLIMLAEGTADSVAVKLNDRQVECQTGIFEATSPHVDIILEICGKDKEDERDKNKEDLSGAKYCLFNNYINREAVINLIVTKDGVKEEINYTFKDEPL